MSEKVTVTKEVAEALYEVERNYISTGITLNFHVTKGLSGKYAPLQTLDIEDLAKALINGYEVEKTPEEKVSEYYRKHELCTLELSDKYNGIRIGIRTTLDLLGINIEGVNAD